MLAGLAAIGTLRSDQSFGTLQAPDMEVEAERLETAGQNVVAFERGRASGRASEIGADIDFTTVYEFQGRKISRIQVFLNREEALEAVGRGESA